MGKKLFIAEKPSVAREFAKALGVPAERKNGYMESEAYIITWCVGHLITMSYPDKYDASLKRWSMETLPFIPKEYRYEVIDGVKQQFEIVSGLLNRGDVETIYVCTDSGREGEYIYRLVEQMAGVSGKRRLRVWIDSQTEEEIRRGIDEAKDLAEYDNLSASAYLRAKEDYLIGINFSRLLTLKFGSEVAACMKQKYAGLSIGRVMTCVLGMVVNREREIRNFVKTPYYRVIASVVPGEGMAAFDAAWRAVEGSYFYEYPGLYKENGFRLREDAQGLIDSFYSYAGGEAPDALSARLLSRKTTTEKKKPPQLFNLAELQNECAKRYKISPDETLKVIQELYEKKLVTYPRTDARVLSTAAAKEIEKNIKGLLSFAPVAEYAKAVLEEEGYRSIAKTKYVDDKQITDHYAIVPTGQGFFNLKRLSSKLAEQIYELICRRFLSIFYPPAEYHKYALELTLPSARYSDGKKFDKKGESEEHFFANFKVMTKEGYLKVYGMYAPARSTKKREEEEAADIQSQPELLRYLAALKKGDRLPVSTLAIRDSETAPPVRYNSGSMILAMENAGQLIEDEELRAQIKGSGIGTSATRAEILKKLVHIGYLKLDAKTQMITPAMLGELVYDVAEVSMKQLLNPVFTASWEKGLTMVAAGEISPEEYMQKLEAFICRRTAYVKDIKNPSAITGRFREHMQYYQKK